jgi:hypothetical protein
MIDNEAFEASYLYEYKGIKLQKDTGRVRKEIWEDPAMYVDNFYKIRQRLLELDLQCG